MMGRPTRQESDDGPSAPMWMVTFSDCMNLLLTFFVVLVTFSSYDEDTRRSIQALGGSFRKALLAFGDSGTSENVSVAPANEIWAMEEPDFGAEKPTLASRTNKTSGTLKEDARLLDFRDRKVFTISSKRVFLGNGAVLSPEGRYILATMASFIKDIPGRTVISETGAQRSADSRFFGLPRAWAVVEYLTSSQNLDKERFSISAATTVSQQNLSQNTKSPHALGAERLLEIVFLDRSVYD